MPATEWGWLISPEEFDEWTIEDTEDLTLINKPAHVVCHPSKQGPWSSVAGAYKEHFGIEKAFMVSRLDRETSGIILFAKKRPVSRQYQMALQSRRVSKSYLAILEGELKDETLAEAEIGQDKRSQVHSKNCVKVVGSRKEALTRFTPIYSKNGYTLAHVRPLTGRKHQIRVHAQHIGYQVVGDKLYGPDETLFLDFIENGWNEKLASALPINRQALHAYRMVFEFEDEKREFVAPMAQDLSSFCESRLGLGPKALDSLLQRI